MGWTAFGSELLFGFGLKSLKWNVNMQMFVFQNRICLHLLISSGMGMFYKLGGLKQCQSPCPFAVTNIRKKICTEKYVKQKKLFFILSDFSLFFCVYFFCHCGDL